MDHGRRFPLHTLNHNVLNVCFDKVLRILVSPSSAPCSCFCDHLLLTVYLCLLFLTNHCTCVMHFYLYSAALELFSDRQDSNTRTLSRRGCSCLVEHLLALERAERRPAVVVVRGVIVAEVDLLRLPCPRCLRLLRLNFRLAGRAGCCSPAQLTLRVNGSGFGCVVNLFFLLFFLLAKRVLLFFFLKCVNFVFRMGCRFDRTLNRLPLLTCLTRASLRVLLRGRSVRCPSTK